MIHAMQKPIKTAGLFGLSAVVALSCLSISSDAFAAIRLKLTYDDELTFKLTTVSTSAELDFVLNGKDVRVYSVNGTDQTEIGDRRTGHGYYYGPLLFKVGLRNGVIDLYATYKTHVTHTQVRSDGQSSCAASITTRLRPGAQNYVYEMPGMGSVDVLKINLSNIRCELIKE